ncbi:MAG: hypothetical protein HOP29_08785 [Phycisphaerales bacterium]|nr:hypothetical protein [Phycisphaerales bacterium]
MSIAKRIREGLNYLERGDSEAALTPLCNVVGALAGGTGREYKQWLADRMPILSCALLDCGPATQHLHVPVRTLNPRIAPADPHGSTDFVEILYHLFRCGLDHKCAIDSGVQNNAESSLRRDPSSETLYVHYGKLAMGLVLAVVSALPENQSGDIAGHLNGYPLRHFCGLDVDATVAMIRGVASRSRFGLRRSLGQR